MTAMGSEEGKRFGEDDDQMWDYKVVEIPSKMGGFLSTKKKDPEDKLNKWGRQGWELVESLNEDGGKTQALIFKRPLNHQSTTNTRENPFRKDEFDDPTRSHEHRNCPSCSINSVWMAVKGDDRYLKCDICGSEWVEEREGGLVRPSIWELVEGDEVGKTVNGFEFKS